MHVMLVFMYHSTKDQIYNFCKLAFTKSTRAHTTKYTGCIIRKYFFVSFRKIVEDREEFICVLYTCFYTCKSTPSLQSAIVIAGPPLTV